MLIATKIEKALEFVVAAANAGAYGLNSKEYSRQKNIKRRYLEASLQAIRKAGILVGRRGPTGGYSLVRPASNISVAEIVLAIIEDCPDEGEPLSMYMIETLSGVSVADWTERQKAPAHHTAERPA